MSARVTLDDVARELERIGRYVDQPTRLVLQQGSPSAGRAWRLFCSARPDGQGGLGAVLGLSGDGYIGWSRTEAHARLQGLADGLEAAGKVVGLGAPRT